MNRLALLALVLAAPLAAQDRTSIDDLVRRLADEEWAVREAAERELIALGPGARAALEPYLSDPDPEVRGRIEHVLVRLWPEGGPVDHGVQAILRLDRLEIRPGENPAARVFLRNVGEEPIVLVGSLDASSAGWRAPRCGFRLLDADGVAIPFPPVARCGNTNELRDRDLVEVAPAALFDPYGNIDDHGFFGDHSWETWKAPLAGDAPKP